MGYSFGNDFCKLVDAKRISTEVFFFLLKRDIRLFQKVTESEGRIKER